MQTGPPVVPRPAATVIVLRESPAGFEVLLVKRNPRARFMGGAWVFPGGALDREEVSDDGLRSAAVRELGEEAGIVILTASDLIPFSRWITPSEVKIRFDTWFFLAVVGPDTRSQVDGEEVVEARWYTPAEALRAGSKGVISLVFPTIKHLEELAWFATAAELIAYARKREIRPVLPRMRGSGEAARLLLPGEPGYGPEPEEAGS